MVEAIQPDQAQGPSGGGVMSDYGDEDGVAIFTSGAKSSEEEPRYDLIPLPAMRLWAERLAYGAARHGTNNWQKGKDDPDYRRDRLNHAMEHLKRYQDGDRS